MGRIWQCGQKLDFLNKLFLRPLLCKTCHRMGRYEGYFVENFPLLTRKNQEVQQQVNQSNRARENKKFNSLITTLKKKGGESLSSLSENSVCRSRSTSWGILAFKAWWVSQCVCYRDPSYGQKWVSELGRNLPRSTINTFANARSKSYLPRSLNHWQSLFSCSMALERNQGLASAQVMVNRATACLTLGCVLGKDFLLHLVA